jgi:hypothetical protein
MRRSILAALLALLGQGCGTFVFHNPENVTITSNVPGALATASGEGQSCRTPGQLQLDRGKDHWVTVTAEGYHPVSVKITSSYSWWRIATSVAVNTIHGFATMMISSLVGWWVDLGSGAWQTLDQDDLQVWLPREEQPALVGTVPLVVHGN